MEDESYASSSPIRCPGLKNPSGKGGPSCRLDAPAMRLTVRLASPSPHTIPLFSKFAIDEILGISYYVFRFI